MSLLRVFLAAAAAALPRPEVGPLEPASQAALEDKVGSILPAATPFLDEAGRRVRLSDFLGSRPVVLVPVYYGCTSLCGLNLTNLLQELKTLPLVPGKDYELVAFSFDPREPPALAASKRAEHLGRWGRPGAEAGWHFLVSGGEEVDELLKAAGFVKVFDPATNQYAHPAAVFLLTPQGRLARALSGVERKPRDLRLAIAEAAAGKTRSLADRVMLLCYRYDPKHGRYGLFIMRLLQALGALTVAAIAGLVLALRRREPRKEGRP